MKKPYLLSIGVRPGLALAGRTGLRNGSPMKERASAQEGAEDNEVAVGGFSVEGPNGGISIPEVTVTREVVEDYVERTRPIIEDGPLYVSRYVNPDVELRNRTLTRGVEAGSLEEARAEVAEKLEGPRRLTPPEGMEPLNRLLVASHVQALAAETEAVFGELERVQTVNPDNRLGTRG